MKTFIALLLMTTAASAQTITLTEQQKINALMHAYVFNNNSIVGWGSIDVSGENLDAKVVKTETIIPTNAEVIEWTERNMLDRAADVPILRAKGDSICERYGLRKVTSKDGLSWHCRR
jgi:hypothetical protein